VPASRLGLTGGSGQPWTQCHVWWKCILPNGPKAVGCHAPKVRDSNDITFSAGVLFTTSNGSVGSPPLNIDTQILVGESVTPQIRLATNTPGLATFTGTGVRKSYSALFGYDSSVALQYIDTMLATGGDFQGDSETQPILFNVVPEPSALWLLLTALLAWRFLPQRRCRRYCNET